MASNCENDPLRSMAKQMCEAERAPSHASFRNRLLMILYSVGILGVKKATYEAVSWSQLDSPVVSESEIKNTSQLEVHPMLHSALGVRERSRGRS